MNFLHPLHDLLPSHLGLDSDDVQRRPEGDDDHQPDHIPTCQKVQGLQSCCFCTRALLPTAKLVGL